MFYIIVNSSLIISNNIEYIIITNNPTIVPTKTPLIELNQLTNNPKKILNENNIIIIIIIIIFIIILFIICIYIDLKKYIIKFIISKKLKNNKIIELNNNFFIENSKHLAIRKLSTDSAIVDFGMHYNNEIDCNIVNCNELLIRNSLNNNRFSNNKLKKTNNIEIIDILNEIINKIVKNQQKIKDLNNNKNIFSNINIKESKNINIINILNEIIEKIEINSQLTIEVSPFNQTQLVNTNTLTESLI